MPGAVLQASPSIARDSPSQEDKLTATLQASSLSLVQLLPGSWSLLQPWLLRLMHVATSPNSCVTVLGLHWLILLQYAEKRSAHAPDAVTAAPLPAFPLLLHANPSPAAASARPSPAPMSFFIAPYRRLWERPCTRRRCKR